MTGREVAAVIGQVLAEWADTGYWRPVAHCGLTARHALHDWPAPRRNYPAPPIWHCPGTGEPPRNDDGAQTGGREAQSAAQPLQRVTTPTPPPSEAYRPSQGGTV